VGDYLYVGSVRLALKAFEENFDEALSTMADLLGQPSEAWFAELRAGRIPYGGLPGQEFDSGGRHISEKSG